MSDFARWQVRSRLASGPIVYPWIHDAKMNVRRGETGFTFNIYCGLHDFEEMSYLLHVLRPETLFADVGANVGSYTILASAVRRARAVSFEPVPDTFARLQKNLQLNNLDALVTACNTGVADKPGIIHFSTRENCCNHVLSDTDKEEGLEVKVVTLDEVFVDSCPSLMKVDVEGFEYPVLKGATSLLQNPTLNSILLELNAGLHYGHTEHDTLALLKSHGFAAYHYDPFRRLLTPREPSPGNVLFIRDVDRAQALVSSSESFRVKGIDL